MCQQEERLKSSSSYISWKECYHGILYASALKPACAWRSIFLVNTLFYLPKPKFFCMPRATVFIDIANKQHIQYGFQFSTSFKTRMLFCTLPDTVQLVPYTPATMSHGPMMFPVHQLWCHVFVTLQCHVTITPFKFLGA